MRVTDNAVPLIATVEFRFQPDLLDRAHEIVDELLVDTRAFPGLVEMEELIDIDDPAVLVMYEVWESAEAEAAYREWRAGEGAVPALREVLAGPPVTKKYHHK